VDRGNFFKPRDSVIGPENKGIRAFPRLALAANLELFRNIWRVFFQTGFSTKLGPWIPWVPDHWVGLPLVKGSVVIPLPKRVTIHLSSFGFWFHGKNLAIFTRGIPVWPKSFYGKTLVLENH